MTQLFNPFHSLFLLFLIISLIIEFSVNAFVVSFNIESTYWNKSLKNTWTIVSTILLLEDSNKSFCLCFPLHPKQLINFLSDSTIFGGGCDIYICNESNINYGSYSILVIHTNSLKVWHIRQAIHKVIWQVIMING